ncbi:hypothetical protein B0H17DRAFT_1179530 [Mycena rosella]|uniref:Uncharacterized protein n=1 Tax=Mycena rosella TaxID=1033263 RepID=A0AAD7DI04_MYCRO|nr:hypothetical protein B0H17DRAFT_1179530 [Mycena rosella]
MPLHPAMGTSWKRALRIFQLISRLIFLQRRCALEDIQSYLLRKPRRRLALRIFATREKLLSTAAGQIGVVFSTVKRLEGSLMVCFHYSNLSNVESRCLDYPRRIIGYSFRSRRSQRGGTALSKLCTLTWSASTDPGNTYARRGAQVLASNIAYPGGTKTEVAKLHLWPILNGNSTPLWSLGSSKPLVNDGPLPNIWVYGKVFSLL